MRHVNWPTLLAQEIKRSSGAPFSWGAHDCALFVADCIHAMTGVDPAEAFRGVYDCKESAAQAMIDYAGGGIEALAQKMATTHGYAQHPVAFAQRGDVVLCDLKGTHALGIVAMNGREALVAAENGLRNYPLSVAVTCWRVQ